MPNTAKVIHMDYIGNIGEPLYSLEEESITSFTGLRTFTNARKVTRLQEANAPEYLITEEKELFALQREMMHDKDAIAVTTTLDYNIKEAIKYSNIILRNIWNLESWVDKSPFLNLERNILFRTTGQELITAIHTVDDIKQRHIEYNNIVTVAVTSARHKSVSVNTFQVCFISSAGTDAIRYLLDKGDNPLLYVSCRYPIIGNKIMLVDHPLQKQEAKDGWYKSRIAKAEFVKPIIVPALAD